jgi:hypothetical protein
VKKLAQGVNIGEQYWRQQGQSVKAAFPDINTLVSILIKNIYVIAGIILFFLLIGGGIMVIMGAGQNNPEQAAKGQKAVTSAIIGFLVIFGSYWIIRIISAVTGLDILSGAGV